MENQSMSNEEKAFLVLDLITQLLLVATFPTNRKREVAACLDFVDNLKKQLVEAQNSKETNV